MRPGRTSPIPRSDQVPGSGVLRVVPGKPYRHPHNGDYRSTDTYQPTPNGYPRSPTRILRPLRGALFEQYSRRVRCVRLEAHKSRRRGRRAAFPATPCYHASPALQRPPGGAADCHPHLTYERLHTVLSWLFYAFRLSLQERFDRIFHIRYNQGVITVEIKEVAQYG